MKTTSRISTWLLAALFGCLSFSAKAASLAPASGVSPTGALADAQLIASQHAGAHVMRIAGKSMHPYFGDGALIVVKEIDSARLRPGMVVVYVNRFGEKVAHRLLSNRDGGWVAKGYNNDREDSTLVNASNLVGVVYATFFTHSAETGSVALEGALPGVDVALAAPAR